MLFLRKSYRLILPIILLLIWVYFVERPQSVSIPNQHFSTNIVSQETLYEKLSRKISSAWYSLTVVFWPGKSVAQASSLRESSLQQSRIRFNQNRSQLVLNKKEQIENRIRKENRLLKENTDKDKESANNSGNFLRDLPEGILEEEYCRYLNPLWGKKPYLWQLVSGELPVGMSLDVVNGMYCGKPMQAGLWSFTIKVKDASGDFILIAYSQTILNFRIEETPGDLAIHSCPENSGFVGVNYFDQLSAQGGQLPYFWNMISPLPAGLSFDSSYGIIRGIPLEAGSFPLKISVRPQESPEASISCALNIETSPLFLTIAQCPDGRIAEEYSCQIEAQGGQPTYAWRIVSGMIPEGLSFDTQTGRIFGTPTKKQTTTFTAQVKDSEGKTDAAQLRITILGEDLKIATQEAEQGKVCTSYYQMIEASGGEPNYQWALEGLLPEGLEFQDQGMLGAVLIGTPQKSLNAELTFTVTDAQFQTDTKKLRLIIEEPDALEITTPLHPIEGEVGKGLVFQFEAQGGAFCESYTWDKISGDLPKGLEFTQDGILKGMPQESFTGIMAIRVTDAAGKTDTKEFELYIQGEEIPQITTGSLPCGFYLKQYAYQCEAKGGAPPYAWQADANALPRDLSLNADGKIFGIPQEIGKTAVYIEVHDQANNRDSKNFDLTIIKELKILTNALSSGEVNKDYKFTIVAEGGDETAYQWSIVEGGVPGLRLDQKQGILQGIPTTAGNFSLTIELRNQVQGCSELVDRKTFTLEIKGSPLNLKTIQCPDGRTGKYYECLTEAEGGTMPYVWSIASGTLSKGLILSSLATGQGKISGTPEESGISNFSVRVTDTKKESDAKSASIKIVSELPHIEAPQCLDSQVNLSYECQLKATGGSLPYMWSIISGQLPDGLNLNSMTGLISGTPLEPAEVHLNVQLTDQAQENDQTRVNFSIKNVCDLSPISNFIARPSNAKAGLAWRNSSNPCCDHTEIYRSPNSSPQNPSEGTKVYAGKGNNIVDNGLTNDTAYYYSAFCMDTNGNFSPLNVDSKASVIPHEVSLNGPYKPFIDEVVFYNPLDPTNAFGSGSLPNVVLGPPQGMGEWTGSMDVVSLHAKKNDDEGTSAPYGGTIIVRFTDNIIVNGPGPDFTIFENAFRIFGTDNYWMEPAIVDVSIDGVTYQRFPFDFVPHYQDDGEELDLSNPYSYAQGFAGIKPVFSNNGKPDPTNPAVSGGDSFDLDFISSSLTWIQYIRITSTGDQWLEDKDGWPEDKEGDFVGHTSEAGATNGGGNSGFDLDAATAVHY